MFTQARVAAGLFALLLWSGAQAQVFSGSNVGPIPDGASPNPTYGPPRDITFDVSGLSGTVSDLRVEFNADHTFVGDLRVTLIAPNGKSHLLFGRTGATTAGAFGSSANLVSANTYRFADSFATNWWTAAVGAGLVDIPSTDARTVESGGAGVVNPPAVTSMSEAFKSTPPNGVWRLRFEDGAGTDTGAVTAANLAILGTTGVTRVVTNDGDNGPGSLRQAMLDSQGGDLITFSGIFSAEPLSILLETALPVVASNLAIQGPGSQLLTLQRAHFAPGFPVFETASGNTLTISGMTITNGRDTFFGGGGIRSNGAIVLSDVVLRGNRARVAGGGLFLTASGTIINSSITGNIAGTQGGGVSFQQAPGAHLLIENSTISGNRANNEFGTPNLHGLGAGLFNFANFVGSQTMEVVNSTVVNNVAFASTNSSGGIGTWTSGNPAAVATTTLRNSIVAQNQGDNLRTTVIDGNGTATITSRGFNLSDDYSGIATLTSDVTAPARLGLLARHGAGTPGHLPLAGSAALDAGSSSGRSVDQRGVPRVFDIAAIANAGNGGDGSDIGALETQAVLVSSTADSGPGTLREAIASANADAGLLDDIIFDDMPFATAQVINLQSALPDLQGPVSITGNGADLTVVQRNSAALFRIFTVAPDADASLTGLGIAGGDVGSGDVGGGISNSGVLETTQCVIDDNAANGGGGVHSTGVIRVFDSTLSNNTANFSGGGLYNSGGIALVDGSTISGNEALAGRGGGLMMAQFTSGQFARMSIINSTIANNLNGTGQSGAGLAVVAQGPSTLAGADTRNSLFANNSPENMAVENLGGLIASIFSFGFNLSTDDSSAFLVARDQNNANAALGPLAPNGSPLPTHALLVGSDALDGGNGEGSRTINDQRGSGFARTVDVALSNVLDGDGTDVGAQEEQVEPFSIDIFADGFEG